MLGLGARKLGLAGFVHLALGELLAVGQGSLELLHDERVVFGIGVLQVGHQLAACGGVDGVDLLQVVQHAGKGFVGRARLFAHRLLERNRLGVVHGDGRVLRGGGSVRRARVQSAGA
jgi:hypothetical protein